MPKRSDEFKAQQEQHILDAARSCFVQFGYDRTTMRDIAAAANLSTGALYVYFQTKEAILTAICRLQADQQQAALQRTLAAAPAAALSFTSIFQAALQPFLDTPDAEVRQRELLNLLFWYEATRQSDLGSLMQQLMHTWHAAIVGQITAEQGAQRIAGDLDPDALAAILIALPFGLQLYDLLRQQPQDRTAWLETLGRLLDRGAQAAGRAPTVAPDQPT